MELKDKEMRRTISKIILAYLRHEQDTILGLDKTCVVLCCVIKCKSNTKVFEIRYWS